MNKITIKKEHILYNIGYLSGLHPDAYIFPVLKSNAYGHGLREMVKILEAYNTPYLVVDSIPEYMLARKHTKKRFLLLGETNPVNYLECDHKQLTLAVYNIETIKFLLARNKKSTIHLFLDTGMHREGITKEQLKDVLELLKSNPGSKNLILEGVMSHLASADNPDETMMKKQIETFKEMYRHIVAYGHAPFYRHIGNSAAYISLEEERDFFNARRVGLGLYGYNPLPENHKAYEKGQKLKPALTRTSSIISVRKIPVNETVSYLPTSNGGKQNHHPCADCENVGEKMQENTKEPKEKNKFRTIYTLPVGYKEGLPRHASGKLIARIIDPDAKKPVYLKQIGVICMNLSCRTPVDQNEKDVEEKKELLTNENEKSSREEKNDNLEEEKTYPIHTPVEIVSANTENANTIYNLAKASETIVYECLVRLDPMMRREVV